MPIWILRGDSLLLPPDFPLRSPMSPSKFNGVVLVDWMNVTNNFEFDTDLNAYRPDRARYVHNKHPNYKMAPTAMPARFVVACKAGHLDEFPWNEL